MRLAALLSLALSAPVGAATLVGTDYNGADLAPANGDTLSGTFTDVGLFSLPNGTTVFVAPGVTLAIYASTVSIAGAIDGTARGQLLGAAGVAAGPGSAGAGGGPGGIGGGAGGLATNGGGGGAYGASGTFSGPGGGHGSGGGVNRASGGTAYDSTGTYTSPISADDIFQGSGGGGGGGGDNIEGAGGGSGGGAVYIEAASATITGSILMQGATGSAAVGDPFTGLNPGGGGGGSGGGILLRITGPLQLAGARLMATGGKGGDSSDINSNPQPAGGGGSGGRIKLFSKSNSFFSVVLSTSAGLRGNQPGGGYDVPAPSSGAAGTVSFGTVASSPTALAVQSVYVSSINWNWTATSAWGDADAASRAYRIFPSTSLAPLGSPELAVLTPGATTTGLTPNTTYSRFVTAFTDWGNSHPSDVVSTHTLASAPGAAAASFSNMATTSLTFEWGAGTPANPAHTLYEVNRALDAAFSVGVATNFVVATSISPTGLAANTTYWFRVRAVNIDGIPTDYAAAVATATLSVAPTNPAVGTVYVTSSAFSWSGGTNPSGTRYRAEVSDDNFFTVFDTSITLMNSATFFGLTPGDGYFFRVLALNRNSVASAYSASVSTSAGNLADTSPPSTPGTPTGDRQFSYDGTVMFSWSPASSGVGILDYQLLLGSTPGGNDIFNGNVNVSCHTASGLATGKTYFAQVRARSNAGVVGPFSSVSVGVPVFVTAQAATIIKPRAWPNPANPSQGPVQIAFHLEQAADVTMRVYTLQGRLVREITNRYGSPGNQIGSWDGQGNGGRVAPGGYVVEIRKNYGGRVDVQRLKVAVVY